MLILPRINSRLSLTVDIKCKAVAPLAIWLLPAVQSHGILVMRAPCPPVRLSALYHCTCNGRQQPWSVMILRSSPVTVDHLVEITHLSLIIKTLCSLQLYINLSRLYVCAALWCLMQRHRQRSPESVSCFYDYTYLLYGVIHKGRLHRGKGCRPNSCEKGEGGSRPCGRQQKIFYS